ncbi:ATP-binding cassette domain-containing protein [Azospirillum sp. YIM B02556]|uniref:ATP-binding cassette domain-containing protein n=1 Tax=Azospirillum endophyticum TaxID=2800326 RepID=A0ABS1F1J1_9PROT|nr:cysteine peptidase family C39 domain-containing protein [Azospirillum endophyticum]MBK1837295.1 ATP-binding cassette domain-containing protein [Azospirillum endophyticum]
MFKAISSKPVRQGRRQTATPELRQGETAECGLAALGIMLAHHGRPVPLERLRAEAGSTRLGVNARTLVRIARDHGMVARAFRKEPDGLSTLGFPLIAHSRFIHFLVVEAETHDGLLVNDPARGPHVMDWDEVEESFTGIVITIEPSNPAKRASTDGWRPPTVGLALAKRLVPCWGIVAAVMLSAMFARAAGVGAALAAGNWADGLAAPIPLAVVLTAAIAGEWSSGRLAACLGERLADDVSTEAFERLRRLSPTWFARRAPAQVLGVPLAGRTLQRHIGAVMALVELPLLVLPVTASLWIDPQAGVVLTLTIVPALAALGLAHLRRGGVIARPGEPMPLVPDGGTLTTLDSRRMGGRDGELLAQLAGRHAAQTVAGQRAVAVHAGLTATLIGLGASGVGLALLAGIAAVAAGRIGAGGVVTLAALALAAHRPISRLRSAGAAIKDLKAALYRLDDAEVVATEAELPCSMRRPAARLCFQAAGFRPSPLAPPVLSGIDLRLKPGQMLGVDGLSGSGKSVLAKLACGLLDASSGSILLDGVPVATVARHCPGAVVLVDRSSPVTVGTVAENLQVGDRGLRDGSLVAALEQVGLWSDLEPRGGLALALSDGGPELSGGQRRRLALARALLRDPILLVIDEALDALEPALACRILDRLPRSDRVVLVTSRRPATLEGCDHRLRLDPSNAGSETVR